MVLGYFIPLHLSHLKTLDAKSANTCNKKSLGYPTFVIIIELARTFLKRLPSKTLKTIYYACKAKIFEYFGHKTGEKSYFYGTIYDRLLSWIRIGMYKNKFCGR